MAPASSSWAIAESDTPILMMAPLPFRAGRTRRRQHVLVALDRPVLAWFEVGRSPPGAHGGVPERMVLDGVQGGSVAIGVQVNVGQFLVGVDVHRRDRMRAGHPGTLRRKGTEER